MKNEAGLAVHGLSTVAEVPRGFVYFVQEGARGAIKIGWSANPFQRLANLQMGNPRPLKVLGLIANGCEASWHARFSHDWIAGEWFERSPALIAAIKAERTHHQPPHVPDGKTRRTILALPSPTLTQEAVCA